MQVQADTRPARWQGASGRAERLSARRNRCELVGFGRSDADARIASGTVAASLTRHGDLYNCNSGHL